MNGTPPLSQDQLKRAGLSERQAKYALGLLVKVARVMEEAPTIGFPSEVVPLLADIRDQQKEHFVCFYLNARLQVVHKEVISIGSLSATIVHPREVFGCALRQSQGVASIILAHNHPSGDVSPSKDDVELTGRMVKAGQIMGIEVLDHLIIGATGFLSLKEKGLM